MFDIFNPKFHTNPPLSMGFGLNYPPMSTFNMFAEMVIAKQDRNPHPYLLLKWGGSFKKIPHFLYYLRDPELTEIILILNKSWTPYCSIITSVFK